MKKYFFNIFITLLVLIIGVSCNNSTVKSDRRGPAETLKDDFNYPPPKPQPIKIPSANGQTIMSSYSGSYALLIGQSDYTNGWADLNSIPSELKVVKAILIKQGFTVETASNLKAGQLDARFKKFIDDYGYEENNRLLFFYSGHGHTRKNGEKGYLVPTDAANPNIDEKAFLRKALNMNNIVTLARNIEAKHALFLFDSCFSGTVFQAKDLPKVPRQLTQATQLPVRQFITAGSADETVPASSTFTPAFVDALKYGWGDLTKDGYVTGQELGLYLQSEVPKHTQQTPQFGKIKDYKLSRGDFVFIVGTKAAKPKPVNNQQAQQAKQEQAEIARQEQAEIARLNAQIASLEQTLQLEQQATAEAAKHKAELERLRQQRVEIARKAEAEAKKVREREAKLEFLRKQRAEMAKKAETAKKARLKAEEEAKQALLRPDKNYAIYQFSNLVSCRESTDGYGGNRFGNFTKISQMVGIKSSYFKIFDELNGEPVSRCTKPYGGKLTFGSYKCYGKRKLIVVALGRELDWYSRQIRDAIAKIFQANMTNRKALTLVTLKAGRIVSEPLLQCEDLNDMTLDEAKQIIYKKIKLRFGAAFLRTLEDLELVNYAYQNQLDQLDSIFYLTDGANMPTDIAKIYSLAAIPKKIWKEDKGIKLTVLTMGDCAIWRYEAKAKCHKFKHRTIETVLKRFVKY